jgi:hypothetical protein
MLKTLWAVIREGKIEPSEVGELPEGARVLVTILPDEDGMEKRRQVLERVRQRNSTLSSEVEERVLAWKEEGRP